MKTPTAPPKSQRSSLVQPGDDELRRQLARREAELAELRDSLATLRDELCQRDDRIEGALYELAASSAIARESGAGASQKVAYFQMIRCIREHAHKLLPRDATVIVASKGFEELTRLYGRRGLHFPVDRTGQYAGYYPSNSLSAIAQLETLRGRGATHFLLPSTAFWWLEKYPEFSRHLESHYRLLTRDDGSCAIYSLCEPSPWTPVEEVVAECRVRLGRELSILDWESGGKLAARFPQCSVFSPAPRETALPYLDGTIDVVALPAGNRAQLKEARRLATAAVVVFDESGAPEIAWRAESIGEELPSVSIVIPVHNGIATTEACLRSLRETLPQGLRGEIIVVDDASSDETPARLRVLAEDEPRLKVLRNETNLGFLGTTNRGAAAATGDILVFLNNDTILLPGWLPPLLRVLRDFPRAGAVGGKLIFPDGTLQEAGGMIFKDGTPAHFGRDDHALDAGIYNFVREVDYCSAALLATPRALWESLGGLDKSYAPAYFEDTDFCFKVRAAGKRIYFQPESAVVHVEGASCGTDLTQGAKRHQVTNQARFTKKWSKLIAKHPARPDYHDKPAWRALALRGAVEVKS